MVWGRKVSVLQSLVNYLNLAHIDATTLSNAMLWSYFNNFHTVRFVLLGLLSESCSRWISLIDMIMFQFDIYICISVLRITTQLIFAIISYFGQSGFAIADEFSDLRDRLCLVTALHSLFAYAILYTMVFALAGISRHQCWFYSNIWSIHLAHFF